MLLGVGVLALTQRVVIEWFFIYVKERHLKSAHNLFQTYSKV